MSLGYMKYMRIYLLLIIIIISQERAVAQCFATPGNPVGGAENIGVMMKNHLRIQSSFRYHLASNYYKGSQIYQGDKRTLDKAYFNYGGLMAAYGITNQLTLEVDAGYFFNKTQEYLKWDGSLTGSGFSNISAMLKYALYQDMLNRVEFTMAAGGKIPLSTEYQRVDGVVLPIDLQPSTASYGIKAQTFLVKENSVGSWRIFWINRYEKNFENPYNFIFGDLFSSAIFYSKHTHLNISERFKHWTLIMQARYEYNDQNTRNKQTVPASGGHMVVIAPQINCSIDQKWNLSVLFEKAIYRYYNNIQLGGNYSIGVQLSRDIPIN